MDCPHKIPPSGTLVPHHKAHRNNLDTTGRTNKVETGQNHSLDTADITALAAMIYTEAAPEHNNVIKGHTINI